MLYASTANAGILESLVMPGPVAQGHAEFEANCEECHSAFKKERQNTLCLACHKEIAGDVLRTRGFHGSIPNLSSTDCKHCHTEHKGRDADIVGLDADTFDHGRTEFALLGAHLKTGCSACHEPGGKYREAPSQCVDCHETDEPHKGRLGTECASCHEESAWQKTLFDHDETSFRLTGEHRITRCEQCHVNERYQETPSTCIACHSLDDVHAGRHGERCDTCHTPEAWDKSAFNHDTETDFPLAGIHRDTRCAACHSGDFRDDTKGKNCFACHEEDDDHRGRNGQQCEGCHSPKGWIELGFDHSADTEFPLRGLHLKLACESCHAGQVFDDKLETSCQSCHMFDDSHRGGLGSDCSECHAETGWNKVRFDHNRDTEFTLRGAHVEVLCQGCHTAQRTRAKISANCYSCHKQDDVHKGQEGEKCARCHNEQAWGAEVFFEHDITAFPLIGLHAVAPCEECHVTAAYKDTPSSCVDCHKSDDEHRERLGPRCGQCHNPNGWALWVFDHDRQTDYVLDGAHRGLACVSCHRVPVTTEVSVSTTCGSCHRQDDVHRGSFGPGCDRCHVTERFDLIQVK
ncbi:MAG: cytochrome C [Gammaproteobacteria bacterium]|nr:cytochrome C [Gammaproteobacteria bacterium]